MKNYKKVMVLAFTLAIGLSMNAQEYNINFMHNAKWKKVLKMAKKQNKPIFVDAYTTWCGPCKTLSKEVFTQKEVADFFNDNFINVKLDMEKGEAIGLKTDWKITAFPTLLYFNEKGEIIHRVVGAYNAKEFLAYSKMSLDENKMAVNLQKRYDQGERDGEFMYDYLVSLRLGYFKELEQKVSNDYFNSLAKEDLLKEENWNVINHFMTDPVSKEFQYLVTNRDKLYATIGKEDVDTKFVKTINKQTEKWLYWYDGSTFPTERENELITFLQKTNYNKAPFLLADLLANKYSRLDDKEQYLTTVNDIVKFNLAGSSRKIVGYANHVISSYTSDGAYAKALSWLQIADGKETKVENRAAILTAKSNVLEKLGNKTEAELVKLEAEKADKEAEEAGTKVHTMPMMKMTTK